MHPASILSYYPTYGLLDEIVSYGNYDTINFYFDLKNNLQTLYMEHAIINLVESTIRSGVIDSSVFTSVLAFLSFHKIYSIKRNIKVKFHLFFESGQSHYHKNVSKKYKISRRVDNLWGLDKEKRDLFFDILQKNLTLIERACNKLPDTKVIRLLSLEADFIPYYLIRNNLVEQGPNIANIIYSNDHDLMQCVDLGKNTFIYQKKAKKKIIIKRNEVMNSYTKTQGNLPDEYLPLLMAVIGDPGDDVDGVNGVGPSRFLKMLSSLLKMTGSIDNLYKNVISGKPIFDTTAVKDPNKYLTKVVKAEEETKLISNNLKLVSFEILSRYMDDPIDTEMIKKREHVIKVLNDATVAPLEPLKEALIKTKVYIQGDDLDNLYYNYQP